MKKMECPFPPELPEPLAGMTRERAEQISWEFVNVENFLAPEPHREWLIRAILAAVAEAVAPYRKTLEKARRTIDELISERPSQALPRSDP